MENFDKILLKQLDDKLIPFRDMEVPVNGWINTVRNSLKMTLSVLAYKLKTKPQVVKIFEKNETKGTITLNSMHKIAEAMDCRFVYAIVPKTSLQEIIETQAQKSAVTMVKRISHSMNLESQGLGEKKEHEQISDIKRKLLDNFSKKLWKHETELS